MTAIRTVIFIFSFLVCAPLLAMQAPAQTLENSRKRAAEASNENSAKRTMPQEQNNSVEAAQFDREESEKVRQLNERFQQCTGMTVDQIIKQPYFDSNALIPGENGAATLLHAAAFIGSMSLARLLVEKKGAQLETRSTGGLTPLFDAVAAGRSAMVIYLLSKNAQVNAQSIVTQSTPLHYAAKRNNASMLQILLQAGANINARTKDGETALHAAAGAGQSKNVSLLLKAGADVNSKDNKGMSSLRHAVEADDPVSTHLLIQAGFSIEDESTDGYTALHAAVFYNSFSCMRVLLDAGASPNKANQLKLKHTPLHTASVLGNSAIVELLLLYNTDKTVTDENGKIPGQLATNMHIRKLLLPHAIGSRECYLPELEYCKAVANGDIGLLRSLTHLKNTHPDPIYIAISAAQIESVKFLLANGALLDVIDEHGNTPLHFALKKNHIEIAHLLIDTIVKRKQTALLDKKNKKNQTPLMVAASICLPTTEPIIIRLLGLGVDRAGYIESLPEFMREIVTRPQPSNDQPS